MFCEAVLVLGIELPILTGRADDVLGLGTGPTYDPYVPYPYVP